MKTHFPFTAIVGMDASKRSMICHAIDPRLGGLILLGHRGCAKTTLARAFAEALPPHAEHSEVPFVEIPLGATEDRLLGSVDTDLLLSKGEWASRQGLIEQAHQGILYIDEINLLPDHLADSILDSAATGKHRIERDGLSSLVDAKYILIGSMNPEEGDLRPQLLDRFAHGILVSDDFEVEERMKIVENRMAFDDDPEAFLKKHQDALNQFSRNILDSRSRLPQVQISENLRRSVAQRAKDLALEGMRPELAVLRTSRCLAAWDGVFDVTEKHLEEAWVLCLAHRRPEALTPPPPPPPPSKQKPPQSRQSPEPQSKQRTSTTPMQSHPEAIALEKSNAIQNAQFEHWWHASKSRQTGSVYSPPSTAPKILDHAASVSRICWTNSIVASVKNGWSPGKVGWQLKYRQPKRKPNTWIFMDASRSAGALRFLVEARNTLLSLRGLTKASRFHMALLKNGETSWFLKRGTPMQLDKQLQMITEANGKSFLAQSLEYLTRGIQRQGVMAGDKVLLCSDGLFSPEVGQSAQESKKKMRQALQRLNNLGVPIAWLHPAPKRGMSQWIPRLTEKLPITLLPLTVSSSGRTFEVGHRH